MEVSIFKIRPSDPLVDSVVEDLLDLLDSQTTRFLTGFASDQDPIEWSVYVMSEAAEPEEEAEEASYAPPLDAEAARILEALIRWREEEAPRQGFSPGGVAPIRSLIEIARKRIQNKTDLAEIWGFQKLRNDKYGDDIVRIVTETMLTYRQSPPTLDPDPKDELDPAPRPARNPDGPPPGGVSAAPSPLRPSPSASDFDISSIPPLDEPFGPPDVVTAHGIVQMQPPPPKNPIWKQKGCPECGADLLIYTATARNSTYAPGTKFVGCSNYPPCRYRHQFHT